MEGLGPSTGTAMQNHYRLARGITGNLVVNFVEGRDFLNDRYEKAQLVEIGQTLNS